MSHWRRSPKRDRDILAAAIEMQLVCFRDKDLAPEYHSSWPGLTITSADREQIQLYVLRGLLRYERSGPHGFGVGRVLATVTGLREYEILVQRLDLAPGPSRKLLPRKAMS